MTAYTCTVSDRWRDVQKSKTTGRARTLPATQCCPERSRYRAQVIEKGPDGRRTHSAGCHASKAAADEACRAFIAKQEHEASIPWELQAPTVPNALAAYLDERATSQEGVPINPVYREQLNRLAAFAKKHGVEDMSDPAFSVKLGNAIANHTRPDGKPASPKTKHAMRVLFRALAELALDLQWISFDPLARWKKRRNKGHKVASDDGHSTAQRRAYTLPEIRRMVGDDAAWMDDGAYRRTLAAVDAHGGNQKLAAQALGVAESTVSHRLKMGCKGRDEWRLFALIGLCTGMRAEEVQHLRWRHIDLGKRTVQLALNHPGNKTQRERYIKLCPDLVAALLANPRQDGDSVFSPSIRGLNKSDRSVKFRAFVKRHGVDPVYWPLHALRHSFASLATALRGYEPAVMAMGGWSDNRTFRTYAADSWIYTDDVRAEGWPQFDAEAPLLYLTSTPPAQGQTATG
ncbi:MAG: hypothetical protein EA402_12575 [Planctomycetota bacterium]|nr:MAG: hypothetical protein EA402_12575 [Planctomycetota bacterium]